MTIHPAFVLGPVLSRRTDGTSVADFKARLLCYLCSQWLISRHERAGRDHLGTSNWSPCPCPPHPAHLDVPLERAMEAIVRPVPLCEEQQVSLQKGLVATLCLLAAMIHLIVVP